MTEILIFKGRLISCNCYLLRGENNAFVLVDTGTKGQRRRLMRWLKKHDCRPENLNLIVLTHGDFDHTANALFLRNQYQCPVMIHGEDAPVMEKGHMFINRNQGTPLMDRLTRLLLPIDTMTPDLNAEEGLSLSAYGIEAEIVHLPGHSPGSIGVITRDNALIGGDLLENRKEPNLYFMDDPKAGETSFLKIKEKEIRKVYPGHGNPFPLL